MSFDGMMIHQVVKELNELLSSGRINKIQQPYDNEIILSVRSQRKNYKLLLSAHPQYARIQNTKMPYHNPEQAPLFCMTARKYLDGAIIQSIEQHENDRIVDLNLTHRDEVGDLHHLVLSLEIMGRHSNLLLINKDDNKIIDCIKHVGFSQNSYRTLLPGSEYIEPPKQHKLNPWTINDHELFSFLHSEVISSRLIMDTFQGFGKDSADELYQRLNTTDSLTKAWSSFIQAFNPGQPTLIHKENKYYFTPIDYLSIDGERTYFSNYSELLDAYFGDKADRDRVYQKLGAIEHKLKHIITKNEQKITKLKATLEEATQAELLRQKGELLTTYLHEVPKGATSVTLTNYYTNQPLEIELNPAYSPNANAQKYFQKYQKLKKGVRIVQEQIQHAKLENQYIDTILDQLQRATPLDINVIEEELIDQGYLKRKHRQKKKMKSKPLSFLSSEGHEIRVGRNNLQNDELTLKLAKKTDYWFHAKNIPGSHVILSCNHPTDEEITEAATLAAFYSKYRYSAQVPVDVIQVKHIRKPNGSKPGFVVYEGQKMVLVTPTEEEVERLKND